MTKLSKSFFPAFAEPLGLAASGMKILFTSLVF